MMVTGLPSKCGSKWGTRRHVKHKRPPKAPAQNCHIIITAHISLAYWSQAKYKIKSPKSYGPRMRPWQGCEFRNTWSLGAILLFTLWTLFGCLFFSALLVPFAWIFYLHSAFHIVGSQQWRDIQAHWPYSLCTLLITHKLIWLVLSTEVIMEEPELFT